MNWKNLKLKGKFTVAFGAIILMLIFVAFWAIKGIRGIVGDAEQVIEGNKLRGNIIQKEVDHLDWANAVAELLNNDQVTELHVETNPRHCAFGKWYYSDQRQQAEELVPELKGLLEEIETPHNHLHESAIEIQQHFQQASQALSNQLREAKSDHLIWAHAIKDVVVNNQAVSEIDVEKNPSHCNFGKWLHSPETEQLRNKNPEFNALCKNIEPIHADLHNSVRDVERQYQSGNTTAGKQLYMTTTKPITYDVLSVINEMLEWNDTRLAGMQQAQAIYANKTLPNLDKVKTLLDNIVKTSANNIMTDEVMLSHASNTSTGVILFSIIISILAVILAVVIARGIIKPINKGVDFARQLSEGDLTATINVDQKDEIGLLASALTNMANRLREIVSSILAGSNNIAVASQQMSSTSQEMSQGANEQASSVEEVSSSMEEMAANIQNNTDNARQTENIANNSANGIEEGSKATNTAVDAMKNIAEKIRIINDIAFQTNILALNAAVEAARAGEHGKGFAVVASEVRKLAERSKVAADEIDDLSKNGVDVAERAGSKLSEIVPDIQKTARLVQEIAAASIEQSSGADQVNNAIQQLNNVTQQNAAASEEMATSSEELASQAEQLKEIISFFNTGEKLINNNTHKKPVNIVSKPKTETETAVTKSHAKPLANTMNTQSVNDSDFEQY